MAEFGAGPESSIFNIVGILLTIVLGILLMFLFSRTLWFLKHLIFKLRYVLKNSQLKEKSFFVKRKEKSHRYKRAQLFMKNEVLKAWNMSFLNVLLITLKRYNHIFYCLLCGWWQWEKNRADLLKPQLAFFALTNLISIFVFWTLSLFLANITASESYLMGIIQGLIVSGVGSCISTFFVWAFHYFYTKNIYGAFERASKDIDPKTDRLLENTRFEVDFNSTQS